MNETMDKTQLEQARKSTRSRVARLTLAQGGLPVDLAPVRREIGARLGKLALVVAVLGVLGVEIGDDLRIRRDRCHHHRRSPAPARRRVAR